MKFRLNRKGGAEVLKDMVAGEISALAHQVAGDAGDDARVIESTTDRAVAFVRVPADQQAKSGALTRAASAAGLEVRAKK